MDFSYISIFDFIVFGILIVANIIIFLGGLLVKGIKKILLIILSAILFLCLPFLNVYIIDNYINKVDLEIKTAKKLVYSNSFFINGNIINKGKQDLNKCILYIYIDRFYPIQKPEFTINLDNVKLSVGGNLEFDKVIDNFNFDDKYKKISIRCFK